MEDYKKTKERLIEVYQKTIEAVQDGEYTAESGKKVTLPYDYEMIENSRLYTHKFTVNDIPAYKDDTIITVVNTDSINAGKSLVDEGYRPIVLNFASRHNAGGGVLTGSKAQEESLFRRTNLFLSYYQFTVNADMYGIPENRRQYPLNKNYGGVYTPYATVFRGSDQEGNPFLDEPFKLSFVGVAAINKPRIVDGKIASDLIEATKNKMRTILRIGIAHGHDAIVLGAFGCGAFHNPPNHIAELFKEVINEPELKNKYRKIVFAILEDGNSKNGNLQPFKDVFQQ